MEIEIFRIKKKRRIKKNKEKGYKEVKKDEKEKKRGRKWLFVQSGP